MYLNVIQWNWCSSFLFFWSGIGKKWKRTRDQERKAQEEERRARVRYADARGKARRNAEAEAQALANANHRQRPTLQPFKVLKKIKTLLCYWKLLVIVPQRGRALL